MAMTDFRSLAAVSVVLACSGRHHVQEAPASSAPDDKVTCASYVQMLTDCGVIKGTRLAGCADDDPSLPCPAACVAKAECDEIAATYCGGADNDFAECLASCEASLPAREFACSDGKTISMRWRCDGVPDCANGEDEICPKGTFTCQSGLTIPAAWQCDTVNDCPAGDDERRCGQVGKDFSCADGSSIPASQECDGANDCPAGEDELDCTKLTCS